MITTPTPSNVEGEKLTFNVRRNLRWKGERYKDGDTVEATEAETCEDPFAAWMLHGWVEQLSSQPTPRSKKTKSPATTIPQTPSAEIETVRQIPWAHIKESPYNPREDFSTTEAAAASMRELVDSIKEQGIIQPLIVRPCGMVASQERFELVAGERRWKAAGQIGLETVPCLVRDLAKQRAIEQQALENIARRDLNAIEEGEGYRTLMDDGGLSVPQIVKKTGKSEATIYSRLKLLDCPFGVRKAVIEGRLPASTADLVAREEDPTFRNRCMDAILWPDAGDSVDEGGTTGKAVLSFRAAKAWIATNKPAFMIEQDWLKRQRDSHAYDAATKVLTVTESEQALWIGGNVRDTQTYVRPTDPCFADEQKRTYGELAEVAGVRLPKPVLARDPGAGAPVVLLPRQATETLLAAVIPEAGAYQRRQKQEETQRQQERRDADARREELKTRSLERAHSVVRIARERIWSAQDEEDFCRLLVRERFAPFIDEGYGLDDLYDALREHGVPVEKEDEDGIGRAWCDEYLRGCDLVKLRAWLVWFAVRDTDAYEPDAGYLREAETIFGVSLENS